MSEKFLEAIEEIVTINYEGSQMMLDEVIGVVSLFLRNDYQCEIFEELWHKLMSNLDHESYNLKSLNKREVANFLNVVLMSDNVKQADKMAIIKHSRGYVYGDQTLDLLPTKDVKLVVRSLLQSFKAKNLSVWR
jgi:hypothetical protein